MKLNMKKRKGRNSKKWFKREEYLTKNHPPLLIFISSSSRTIHGTWTSRKLRTSRMAIVLPRGDLKFELSTPEYQNLLKVRNLHHREYYYLFAIFFFSLNCGSQISFLNIRSFFWIAFRDFRANIYIQIRKKRI